jgi:hypothetical protein
MYILPITCVLLIGCLDTFPFHRIGFERNGIALDLSIPYNEKQQIINKPSDSCYRDGIFYPDCKDTEDKLVWHYHNLLKNR